MLITSGTLKGKLNHRSISIHLTTPLFQIYLKNTLQNDRFSVKCLKFISILGVELYKE